jgi:alkylated DNA repair protein (DNA oxidative demethylase)
MRRPVDVDTRPLFALADAGDVPDAAAESLAPGAVLLRAFALAEADRLWALLPGLLAVSPWRHYLTPGGRRMGVANTNCGALGWVSDARGYRYTALDPETGQAWPAMPEAYAALARAAAARAGFAAFEPDACLVNRYQPGVRLGLHQDRDERDATQPIVSVSLGLPATFQFGGARRADPLQRVALGHGDVVVWGGPARFHHHGVLTLRDGEHPLTGRCRVNLTFRRAG